jgi:hypothetical protein
MDRNLIAPCPGIAVADAGLVPASPKATPDS